ncbi:MAG: hypothetical protein DRJ98_05275 [Thermoprotei archaeon]|nr:MAG: hypothetical protein DRJ98_05275 [Thermoprotei archaeon]
MVKAVDLERLLTSYSDSKELDKAEAVYLLLRRVNRGVVAEALYSRYGSVSALDEALGDLASIGLEASQSQLYIRTEDTGEDLYAAVARPFLALFVPLIVQRLSERPKPSFPTSKLLYLLVERGLAKPSFSHELSRLRENYKLLYGEEVVEEPFKDMVKELQAYWVVEFTDGYRVFYPVYLNHLLPELRAFTAKVSLMVEPP